MTVLRPRDGDALRSEIRSLANSGVASIFFGGEVSGRTLLLSEFAGIRTKGLRGLSVEFRHGLGGASIAMGKPLSVSDYRIAVTITHDYDVPVLSEGINSVLAVPIFVNGAPRAVVYGAERSRAIGARVGDLVLASARRLAFELKVRDEVDRRLRLREAQPVVLPEHSRRAESLRLIHADLCAMAASVRSPLGAELRGLAGRMAQPVCAVGSASSAQLSRREVDVLAQVALGCTTTEIAVGLSIKAETVKSYLRSAAAKLDTHTRHQTVSRARQAGLIP